MDVDFPHMSISVAPPKYPLWSTTIGMGRLEQWVRKLWKGTSMRQLKMRSGWKLNGNLPILALQIITFHLSFSRFKLHLRSKVDAGCSVGSELPLLPLNKTVVEVFGDFLRYLLECASSYIQYNYANGHDLWDSVKSHIDFVLSHPNGWEGTQQSEMRRAAVLAGLVSDNASGHARLSFVTEGEATLHFSVQNGLPDGVMKVCRQIKSKHLYIYVARMVMV